MKISKEEIKKYELKTNIKIFETSAKTGININEAFNYLIYLLLKKRANQKTLAVFINIFNIYSDLEISLILYPNCRNLLEKKFSFKIYKNYVTLNINENNSQKFYDGFIFFIDNNNKESIEYIINDINKNKNYSLNDKSIIIINEKNKDKKIIIKKEIDNLSCQKGINIFKVYNINEINKIIEHLARLIILNEGRIEYNKLNKYINF